MFGRAWVAEQELADFTGGNRRLHRLVSPACRCSFADQADTPTGCGGGAVRGDLVDDSALGFAEAEFIAERDGFYLATLGANG